MYNEPFYYLKLKLFEMEDLNTSQNKQPNKKNYNTEKLIECITLLSSEVCFLQNKSGEITDIISDNSFTDALKTCLKNNVFFEDDEIQKRFAKNVVHTLNKNTATTFKTQLIIKGKPKNMEVKQTPYSENLVLTVINDVTPQALLKENLTLSAEQAEKEKTLKAKFISEMSQEVRTPMNAVLGYAHLLGKHNHDAKEKEELLNQIISSARNITLLIDDLVNTTLIVNNQISIICNDFNINVILNNLKSFYSKKIEMVYNNQINIVVEEIEEDKALVYIDSGRIEQILRYILSLAIIKTVPGDIIFGASINNENELKFYTTFFASDFPDDIIDNINDSIDFAIEILDTALGKEFMGLKIANGLVNLMDGKIDIRKTSKGKVTIWFNIPIPKGKLASHSPDIGNEYIWKNKVILIAEDEQENTLLFQELFKDTDAHLIFAETGEQIIDLFETLSHIDLILLDIKLPVMNGDDVARYIRGAGSNIPLIAQTAYSYPSTKESLLEAGFNEYFCKPINVRDLMETMNKYLLE